MSEALQQELAEVKEEIKQVKCRIKQLEQLPKGEPERLQLVALLVELLKKENRLAEGLAGAAGAAGPAPTSLADLLASPLQEFSYPSKLPRSGTTSAHGVVPDEIEEWSTFHDEVVVFQQQAAGQLQGVMVPPGKITKYSDRGPIVQRESDIYSGLTTVVGEPLLLISTQLSGMQPVSLEKVDLKHGAPDLGVKVLTTGKASVAVEIKHMFAVNAIFFDPINYPYGMPGKDKPAQDKHIEQLYGYLLNNGVYFGVLCSDREFWFAKLGGPIVAGGPKPPLVITRQSLKRDSRQPSVVAAFLHIAQLAQDPAATPKTMAGYGPGNNTLPPGGGSNISVASLLSTLALALRMVSSALLHMQLWLHHPRPCVASVRELALGPCLGMGGVGRVYEGVYQGVPVCIKVPLKHEDGGGAGQREQAMEHEVAVYRALRALQGRYLPRLVAYGTLVTEAGGRLPFLAVERVVGGVPMDEAADSLLCLAGHAAERMEQHIRDGVRAMHVRGVAHGDVRGPNVLVTPHGDAVIVDLSHAVLCATPEQLQRDVRDLNALCGDPGWRRAIVDTAPGTSLTIAGNDDLAGSMPTAAVAAPLHSARLRWLPKYARSEPSHKTSALPPGDHGSMCARRLVRGMEGQRCHVHGGLVRPTRVARLGWGAALRLSVAPMARAASPIC